MVNDFMLEDGDTADPCAFKVGPSWAQEGEEELAAIIVWACCSAASAAVRPVPGPAANLRFFNFQFVI